MKKDKMPLEDTWYGHFRCDWTVVTEASEDGNAYGDKWHDPGYTASKYPCFGGGGGNILTHDLSDWVGVNALHLKDFQGEDVSMGIWLTGRKHEIIRNDNFHHLETKGAACNREVCSAPEVDSEIFQDLYLKYKVCGNECDECDYTSSLNTNASNATNVTVAVAATTTVVKYDTVPGGWRKVAA